LLVVGAAPASAQVSFHVAAGARYGTALVHDSIVTPFTVRPAVAPALSITALTPLKHGWNATATLDASITHISRHDVDGTTTGLGRLSTIMFAVGVRRDITAKLSAGVDIGGLKYLPADETGIFKLGAGPLAGVGGLVMGWQIGHGLAVEARYDIHSFSTPALDAEGFASSTLVQRFTVSLTGETGGDEP
jgi:hypothetical protein